MLEDFNRAAKGMGVPADRYGYKEEEESEEGVSRPTIEHILTLPSGVLTNQENYERVKDLFGKCFDAASNKFLYVNRHQIVAHSDKTPTKKDANQIGFRLWTHGTLTTPTDPSSQSEALIPHK